MKLIMYMILGLIQGFTEPIPVSSSGHLVIFNALLNVEELNDLNFEIFVNFGSFIAICFFYRKEIIDIIKDFFMYIKTKDKKYEINYKYAWLILTEAIDSIISFASIPTIPAGIVPITISHAYL